MKCRHCVNQAIVKIGHSSLCQFHFEEVKERWKKDESMLKQEAPEMFNALLANVRRNSCS